MVFLANTLAMVPAGPAKGQMGNKAKNNFPARRAGRLIVGLFRAGFYSYLGAEATIPDEFGRDRGFAASPGDVDDVRHLRRRDPFRD